MRKISVSTLSLLSVLAMAATASAGAPDKDKDTSKTTTKTTTTTTTKTTTKDKDAAKDKDKDKDKDAGKTDAAASAMPMPDPDQAILDAAKSMKGTWSCTGTMNGMDGTSMALKGITAKWSQDLDKMWIRGDLKIPKQKGWKRGMSMIFYRTYDAGSKTWTHLSMDNMGGWGKATSTGPDSSGKLTWDGDMSMGAQTMKSHDYEQPGDKKGTMHMWGEMSMDGSKWMPTYDMTCKK